MLQMSGDNPSPFKQPFLELSLAGDGAEKLSSEGILYIDVDGKIEKYITKEHQATGLLVELCKALAKAGAVVTEYARYKGSGGPNAVLRNGVLFYRMSNVEHPPEEVFAYEYREPKYRGPR